MDKFGKVALLYGGNSAEREVSLNSGQAVYEALLGAGVDVHLIDTMDSQRVFNLKAEGFNRAFIALHGRGGEDGQIQAILDWQGIPYTGSGVLACALAMDKVLTKKLWSAFGLPVKKDYLVGAETTYAELCEALHATKFAIKPALEGSSVGISCVSNQAELESAYLKAGGNKEKIMAEPWIVGRELTYALLANEVLAGIEVIASKGHAFYDYEAKYIAEDTQYICPPHLPTQLDNQIKAIAQSAFSVIGAKGWARVDFMLDENNQPWLLEINLSPGMTSHSLVPMAGRAAGLDFTQLVLNILAQAG